MFCPATYHPATQLWEEFVEYRFEAIRADAVRSYSEPDFQPVFSRGSPIDICEHIFLKSLATMGFHIASPEGDIMRLHVKMEDGQPNLFATLAMQQSALYAAALSVKVGDGEAKMIMDNAKFQSWQYDFSDQSKMAEVFQIPQDQEKEKMIRNAHSMRHHTLLHHVQRKSFTIVEDPPIWALETETSQYVVPVLKHFGGWAICIDEAAYQERRPGYLSGDVQLYPPDANDDAAASASNIGRPRLIAAYNAFAAMNFEKGQLSWEKVAQKIESQTGQKPNHKALRNWRDDAAAPSKE